MENTVNQRIKILVELLGLSQGKFSVKVGVAQDLISRYINDKSTPSFEAVEKIYRAFPGLSGRWLLTGEGEMWEESQPKIHQVAVGNGNHQVASLEQCREKVAGLEREVVLLRELVKEKERVIELLKQNS